jgi:hypothetical protein
MLYHVLRNGQTYGPYTLEDLQRYVASGNVLLTDMARTDEMADWTPVSQIVGAMPSAPVAYPPPAVPGYAPANAAVYPDAPNLAWGLVLLFGFFTCGLFMLIWNLVLSSWMKRVQPNSQAIFYYAVGAALGFLQIILSWHAQFNIDHSQSGFQWMWSHYYGHPLVSLLGIGTWVVRLIARFTMRSNLEQHFNGPEPMGLSLSGVMTFFFGGIYFQYHLNRINELKRMARYRGAAI